MNRASTNGAPRPGRTTRRERRKSPRLEYCWPISVETGSGPVLRASTRNVAAGGVLFHVDDAAPLNPGDRVRVLFHVPPEHQDRGAYFQFRAEGEGRVVRSEPAGAPGIPMRGIAVAFDRPVELLESFVGLA